MPLRLLLNAHLPVALAASLKSRGYDVIAAQGIPDLRHLDDEDLLIEAAKQRRALVTYNIRHFAPLARGWAQGGREHWGIILVHPRTIPQEDLGGQIQALERLLASTSEEGLKNQTIFLEPER
jgi:hypothetical protein